MYDKSAELNECKIMIWTNSGGENIQFDGIRHFSSSNPQYIFMLKVHTCEIVII